MPRRSPLRNFTMIALLAVGCAAIGAGCASDRHASSGGPAVTDASFEIPASSLTAVILASKDVLRDYRFRLERVDARSGTVTTDPKASGGILTPWDPDQSEFSQEWEDFTQNQRRVVRVTIEPTSGGEDIEPTAPGDDLTRQPGPFLVQVRTVIFRIHRPGWRLEPTSIRLSSRSFSRERAERGLEPQFSNAVSEDPGLSDRLARAIAARLAENPAP